MTIEHLDMRLTSLEDAGITVHQACVVGIFVPYSTTSDRTNLTAAIEVATKRTTIHRDIGIIHIAVHHIATTKGITCQLDSIRSLVVQFLDIFIDSSPRGSRVLITIAHITVVDGQVGSTIYGTTLTTAIDITLDGRNTIIEAVAVCLTDSHIGYSRNFSCTQVDSSFHEFSVNSVVVHTNCSQITTTIDVTGHTTFNLDVGGCSKASQSELVEYRTTFTTAIDVSINVTTLQLNIGRTCYHGIDTITTTVGVTADITTVHDMDVGLVVLVVRQNIIGIGTIVCAFSVGICTNIGRQTKRIICQIGAKGYQKTTIGNQFFIHICCSCFNVLVSEPLCQRSEVKGITITSTSKHFIGIRTVVHEYIGTT